MKLAQTVGLFSFCLLAANVARADTIASNLTYGGNNTFYWDSIGQSFTTGSDWSTYYVSSIALYFTIDDLYNGAKMYLYSSAYTGTVGDLGTGTNFMASATTSDGCTWSFDDVELDSSTTYYFYVTCLQSDCEAANGTGYGYWDYWLDYNTGNYTGGQSFFASGDNGTAATFSTWNSARDFLFSVNGVPEPSTYAGLAGLAALGFAAMKRRKK
jgi:hypothetical protein